MRACPRRPPQNSPAPRRSPPDASRAAIPVRPRPCPRLPGAEEARVAAPEGGGARARGAASPLQARSPLASAPPPFSASPTHWLPLLLPSFTLQAPHAEHGRRAFPAPLPCLPSVFGRNSESCKGTQCCVSRCKAWLGRRSFLHKSLGVLGLWALKNAKERMCLSCVALRHLEPLRQKPELVVSKRSPFPVGTTQTQALDPGYS